MPQQLEQEVKLDVPPGWSVPDLDGAIPGAQAVALPPLALEATYYDTADLRLARQRVTLRLRRETPLAPTGPGAQAEAPLEEWTLKVPSPAEGAILVRQELTWAALPAARSARRRAPAGGTPGQEGGRTARGPSSKAFPGGEPPLPAEVHPEAARLVRGLVLGLPLVPVAYVATVRERVLVRTSDGRHLAEVDHDSVAGRRLVNPPAGGYNSYNSHNSHGGHGLAPAGDNGRPARARTSVTPTGDNGRPAASGGARFDEVEVELAPGSATEVLHAIAARLRSAGAKPSPRTSKLKEVLGDAVEMAGPQLSSWAATAQEPSRTLAEVLRLQAGACLSQLLEHDIALRAGDPDPEHVHKPRVAVRRARTVLRSFRRLLHAGPAGPPVAVNDWLGTLAAELRWLGNVLGAARDADVRLTTVESRCLYLPEADTAGALSLTSLARDAQAEALRALLDALDADRYVDVLRMLESLARPGGGTPNPVPAQLWGLLSAGARSGTSAMAKREYRSLRKAVRRLVSPPSDAALHRLRVKAKRLRYLSELAAANYQRATKKDALAMAEAATRLQDILGELHDEVVAESWLRQAVRTVPGRSPAPALAAGQLVAMARQVQEEKRRSWGPAWGRLSSHKLTAWLG